MSMRDYPPLWEARYENPVFLQRCKPARPLCANPKTLVTICTFIPETSIARYVSRSQYQEPGILYEHNRLECLKFVLAAYDYFEAGADYDLIIIDNASPSKDAQRYFQSLSIPVIERENTYYSFGAYRDAWTHFGAEYDYFLFHEMDWFPCRDRWLSYFINLWNADTDIGMIGNLIEFREWVETPSNRDEYLNNQFIRKINQTRTLQYNLDSEYLFTSNLILNQMDQVGWMLFPCHPEADLSPAYNELAFEQPILEMGYKLRCFNDGRHTMFYATYNRDLPEQWRNGFEHLAPLIPEQVRLFAPDFRAYFDFYDHDRHDSFVGEVSPPDPLDSV